MPSNDLSETLLRLYRAANEEPLDRFRESALEVARSAVQFDTAMWGTGTVQPETLALDVHSIHLHRQPQEMLADYQAVQHEDTAAASLFGRRHATGAFNRAEWFDGQRRPGFEAFLDRYGHANVLLTVDTDPACGAVQWISLFRGDPDELCTSEQARMFERLSPHMMQAWVMNLRLQVQSDASVPDWPGGGSAVADLGGRVFHADAKFQNLLRAECAAGSAGRLPAAVLEHFRAGAAVHTGRSAVLACRPQHGLLFLHARPRCPADDLTPREMAVARCVAQGMAYKEIARQLGRAPATVRNQIQSIYGKLGIGSIAELVRELRALG